ncbi:hypothetical protein BASA81_001204 [Batrachochytrium salamandrivorans]|nr:hypothetical protein BASA81_001204 [Batrachochytrium salamandrivorans]
MSGSNRGHSLMDWNNLMSKTDTAGGRFSSTRQISPQELGRHAEWSCFRGLVYDISAYARYHPGGQEELFRCSGTDGTLLFDEFHPWVNVGAMLRKCQVGVLSKPIAWEEARLELVQELGEAYYLVTLRRRKRGNAAEDRVLTHCKLATTSRGNRNIERPYTQLVPPFGGGEEDQVVLLVKKSSKPKSMSHELCTAALGSTFNLVMEPSLFEETDSWFTNAKEIGMVVCGSGITPALQIISKVLQETSVGEHGDDDDHGGGGKRLYLVWCHRNAQDWALERELALAVEALRGRLRITHLLSRAEGGAPNFVSGRFDTDFVQNHPSALPLPPDSSSKPGESMILICGTWEFERSARGTMFLSGFASKDLLIIPG